MAAAFRTLGSILEGKAERGEELAAFVEQTVSMAEENAAKIQDSERLSVLYTSGSSGLNTNAKGSTQAQVLDLEEQPKEAKAAVNLKPEPMVQETVAIDTSQIQEADLEKNVDELLLTQSLNEELRQNQNEPEDDLSLTKSLGDLWTKKPGSGE